MEKLVRVLWGFLLLLTVIVGLFVYNQYKTDQFHKASITAMNEQNALLDRGNKILMSNVK